HGMLPLMFLAALPNCQLEGYTATMKKLTARFLKPIYVGDTLLLETKLSAFNEGQMVAEFEYAVKNDRSGAVMTTGLFSLAYIDAQPINPQDYKSNMSEAAGLLPERLIEQQLDFNMINKGDEKLFDFRVRRSHAHHLYQILTDGLTSTAPPDFSSWISGYNPANALAVSLFSTFVGMCIPGKNATFMDFQATCDQPIRWNTPYRFIGTVRFASPSTETITEKVAIRSLDKTQTPLVSGKISAKVNTPPTQMATIEDLKQQAVDLGLKNKVVLITGASRGLGETTAKLFSLYGARVVVNYYRGQSDAQRIVGEIEESGGQAIAVQADVSDRDQVVRMIETVQAELGSVDILINNAVGNFSATNFLELTWDTLQKDIDVIIKGAFHCCQAVLPAMIEKNSGKIINISTIAAEIPPAGQTKYVVAKSGLVGLTRTLAVEFAAHNIQVNMVTPSIMETDLTKNISKMFLEGMKNDTPMQRNATPVDVAKTIVYLASSLASFTTGQQIMVTGGNPPLL
ncbi:MAG: SDR family oxidoreductase, partial [Anaerolineae bacterium]|nr:SDR family oxidoreductase [Anaerolineae bacterium]